MGKSSSKRPSKAKATKPTRRRGWTTDDQFTYLNDILPAFKTAQVNNTTQEIWPAIEAGWFTRWPLATPTEGGAGNTERKKTMDRIKAWFGNHARDASTNAETSSKDVLNLRARKTKKRSTLQAYQRLYYQEKIKPIVEERWKLNRENEKTHPPIPPAKPLEERPTIKFRNDVTKELYKAESEAVKAKVEEFRDDPASMLSDDDDDDPDVDVDEAEVRRIDEAKRVLKAQAAAVNTMGLALKQVEREAGLIGIVILSGADPALGGAIRVASIGQGVNKLGHSFLDLYGPNWDKFVEGPMGDFTVEILSDDDRAALALPGTESLIAPHVAGDFQWRWMGDTIKPKPIFAQGTSSLPAGPGGRAVTCPPAPPKGLSAPAAAMQNQTKESIPPAQPLHTDPEGRAGTCPPALAPLVPPAATQDSSNEPTPPALPQPLSMPTTLQLEVTSGASGDGHIEEEQDVEEPEVAEMTASGKDDRPGMSVLEEPQDVEMKNVDQDDQDDVVARESVALDDEEDENGDLDGVDDQTWDNGEPLTEEERAHLLTLDTFSRAEDMKRRRRKRMEEEATEAVQQYRLSQSPSVPTTIEPSTIDSSKIDSDTCPPSSQLSSIALSHPNRDAWPSWIQECVPELEKMMDSSAWKLVLSQWLELENALGYPSGKAKKNTLANTNRPREIGEWFQYGRRWDKQPLIAEGDITRFATSWWEWWAELQPPSRSSSDPLHMPRLAPVDAAWPEAMKGSNNGFYIVLVALGWWAQGAKFAGQDMKAWDQATADVTWVLDQLKLVAESTRKRSRSDGEDEIASHTSSRPNSKRAKTA